MTANKLPIIFIKRKDYTTAEKVYCPKAKRHLLTEYCKRCEYLHFVVEDDHVKCAFGKL